jgi:hypothetical protein
MVVPVFPYDPRLHSLAQLTDTRENSAITKKLAAILGTGIEIRDFEVLGYRLEKRLVLRYSVGVQNKSSDRLDMVAKSFHRSRLFKALDILDFLEKNGFDYRAADGLTVPRVRGSDPELAVIFMEFAPGLSLHSLAEKVIFPHACSSAGRILRKLHSSGAENRTVYTRMDELGNLGPILEFINDMYPEFEDVLKDRLTKLSQRDPGGPGRAVLTHRDFFDKQVLFTDKRTTLLDCDNAAIADPALDVGNFIAHLILRKLQYPDCAENIDKGIDSFIASYDVSEGHFQSRIEWWREAALLRLSALYLLRPRWRNMIPGFLIKRPEFSSGAWRS